MADDARACVGAPGAARAGLFADVELRAGSLDLRAAFEVAEGEVVGLLGPNAAGKTTLLRALAGLSPLARGRVAWGADILEDTAQGIRLPPEARRVGVVFQNQLLFPHLSALDNVAFGPRAEGASRREARRRAVEWLTKLGVAELAAARPRALSGGQAQRVALARALATHPRLMLLDEPLAALDVSARVHLRRELSRHLATFDGCCLLVTHDPVDAMTLVDRLIVLEDGRVTQTGTPAQIGVHPRSAYVAELVGLNLLRGYAADGTIALPGGHELTGADRRHAGEVLATIHPRTIALHRCRPEGQCSNMWPGTAEAIDLSGDRVRVRIEGPVPLVAEVTPADLSALGLASGGSVWASVDAAEVVVYPARP